MNGNDTIIFSAIIAFIFTSVGSVLSYFLSTKKSEKDAQRDYDYTAKKELYANYEPLVFQFHQLCESAYERITDLAENLREGEGKHMEEKKKVAENVREGEGKHMEEKKKSLVKYATNTAYRIIAPLAAFKLMEQRLTEFDIKLDQKIKYEYFFAKALFNLLRNDRLWKGETEHKKDRSQAIHSSDLDKMCQVLLNDETKGSKTAMIKSIG